MIRHDRQHFIRKIYRMEKLLHFLPIKVPITRRLPRHCTSLIKKQRPKVCCTKVGLFYIYSFYRVFIDY